MAALADFDVSSSVTSRASRARVDFVDNPVVGYVASAASRPPSEPVGAGSGRGRGSVSSRPPMLVERGRRGGVRGSVVGRGRRGRGRLSAPSRSLSGGEGGRRGRGRGFVSVEAVSGGRGIKRAGASLLYFLSFSFAVFLAIFLMMMSFLLSAGFRCSNQRYF